MKRWNIISLVAIVVGLLFIILGVSHQGVRAVTWNQHGFTVNETHKKTLSPAPYDRLVIQTKLPVTVKPGAVNRVTIQQSSLNQKDHPVTAKVTGKTLTLAGGDNRQKGLSVHGLSVEWDDEPYDTNGKITVMVPQRTTLKRVTLNRSWQVRLSGLHLQTLQGTTGGDLRLTNVKVAQPVDLTHGDADLFLTNVTAPRFRVTTSDGDMTVKRSHFKQNASLFRTVDGDIRVEETRLAGQLDSQDGDIHVRNNIVPTKLRVHTDDGDLFGLVDETAGVSATTSDGDIHLFGRHRRSGTHLRPNAKVQYQFSTADGDIVVR